MYNLTMNFQETINVENARYLEALDPDDIKNIIDADGDWEKHKYQDGEKLFSNIDNHIVQLKRYLRTSIKQMMQKDKINKTYHYSSNFQNRGRIFCKGFGVQKCQHKIRGFLIRDRVVDLDMCNAHPTILLWIMNKNFPESKELFKPLQKYVEMRDTTLKLIHSDRRKAKESIIVCMNSGKKTNSTNSHLKLLDNTFKIIQDLLWSKYDKLDDIAKIHKADLSKKGVQNPKGKWLNYICSIKENEVLQKAMSLFQKSEVETPMFDGFTLKKEAFKEDTIQKLNDSTKRYGIKWTQKEHDTSIQIDPVKYQENVLTQKTYDMVKEEFEKNHFMIEFPVMYCREINVNGEQTYRFYTKQNFKELVSSIKFSVNGEQQKILEPWIEDPDRRAYREVKFRPTLDEECKDYFNSFRGWDYNPTENPEETGFVDIFKKQIDVLTNFHQESAEYLIKYIAHSIQKPEVRPNCSVVLKSDEGYGKDMLLDTIALLTNRKYMMNTSEMNDIFGNFNVGIRDKIYLVLNETESKHGYENKEKIKNYITEEKTIIREKNVSQYDQDNYVRLWILSNNFNPVQISPSDRRFSVFKAHYKKPTREHFTEYRKHMKSKESLNDLMYYLLNVDITDFEPDRDRVITDAYKEMKTHNMNPLYTYLNEILFEKSFKETFPHKEQACQSKKTNTILLKSQCLFDSYQDYLYKNNINIKIDYKLMKNILSNIGVQQQKKKVAGTVSNWYVIDPDECKDILKTYIVKEEIEVIDLDDYE